MQETARALADLDVLCSLALVGYEENYICPTIVMNGQINIRDGRHPVIEKFLKREVFVPNDIVLNHDDEEFLLITGPNIAGKSTYMRQAAILMIMAQIGSFIPAREASISPVDRIFTRVGASAVSYTHLDVYKRQDTPNASSIEAVGEMLNLPLHKTIKAVVFSIDGKVVLAIVRGDHEVLSLIHI